MQWAMADGRWNATISTPEGTSGSLRPPISGTLVVDGKVEKLNSSGVVQLSGGEHALSVQTE